MIKSDIPYLNYILDIMKDVEKSVSNISRKNFNEDKKEANIRRLEMISKAINDISREFKDEYSNINWKKFEEIKSTFMNHYFGIDVDIVWDIVKKDLPNLKEQLLKIEKDLKY